MILSDWPNLEAALVDHLEGNTSMVWTADAGLLGGRVPLGIVQRVGGASDLDIDQDQTYEVQVVAATRAGVWMLASQVVRAFQKLNPGGLPGEIMVDEAANVFGFTIDPDLGTPDYLVAHATFNLTVRPHGEQSEEENNNG